MALTEAHLLETCWPSPSLRSGTVLLFGKPRPFLYSPFDTPSNDYVHTRNWLVYKATNAIALGPELDFNINLNGKYGKKGLVSLPIGGRVELSFGTSSIALFLGYQTDKDSRGPDNHAVVGRFALVHVL